MMDSKRSSLREWAALAVRVATWGVSCSLLVLALRTNTAWAQPAEPTDASPRYLASWTAGAPLRLTRNVDFDQDAIAPIFSDLMLGYVFSSASRYRHGLGAGASLNLSADGGFTEPVLAGAQLVVMPSYLGHYTVDHDWLMLGHLGLPILVSGGRSVGLELALGVGYRMLAGVGLYGEAGLNAFPGGDASLHLSASLEVGLFLDYEVLP